jgi:hypothetical protein
LIVIRTKRLKCPVGAILIGKFEYTASLFGTCGSWERCRWSTARIPGSVRNPLFKSLDLLRAQRSARVGGGHALVWVIRLNNLQQATGLGFARNDDGRIGPTFTIFEAEPSTGFRSLVTLETMGF